MMPQFSITTTTTITTTTITTTTAHFSSFLFSYIILFFSFILSHPLYFSYIIFFSPYLLKILSFLSPLFITTSLFLLAFLTFHHHPSYLQQSESTVGILVSSYQKVLNTLSWNRDEDNVHHNFHLLQDIEACMVVLDNDILFYGSSDLSKQVTLNAAENVDELSQNNKSEVAITIPEQGFLPLPPPEVAPKSQVKKHSLLKLQLSKHKEERREKEEKEKEEVYVQCSATFTQSASMKKEKEWKRTLACKLYEERQNSEGSEGMDLLWEEYENENVKVKKNNKNREKTDMKREAEFDEEEIEEEDEVDVKLCCLQALKLSTGKMNLGMKKPNLARFTKALKGIGLFHHVKASVEKKR